MANTKLMYDAVDELLNGIIDVYNEEADEEAGYPYAVTEINLVAPGVVNRYEIEINVWDKYKTMSRANNLMDKIEEKLDKEVIRQENCTLYIARGNTRGKVADEDKTIKRVRALFILDYTEGRIEE